MAKETYIQDLGEAVDRFEDFYRDGLSEETKELYTLGEDIIFYVRELLLKNV